MRAALVSLLVLMVADPTGPPAIVGGVRTHEIAAGDTLVSLGARFGLDPAVLAVDNALASNAKPRRGDRLVVDNRHIAPARRTAGIVLNVAQRMLFVFDDGEVIRGFPVAVGRPDWRTPLGAFEIAQKEIDPVWDVPVSIQAEMARKGQPVLVKVPPGAQNPLGNRWLGLSIPAVGIHSTNQPSSIYRFATHGCVRVHPDDMLELFDLVSVGMPVEIVYEPVLITTNARGEAFLEVHRDAYSRLRSLEAVVNSLLRERGLEQLIASPPVQRVMAERAGRAVLIRE